jgi:hypothetical protein
MKFVRVEGFVSYKDQFLRIEEVGGIDEMFIAFNPDIKDNIPDYKIQIVDKVYLKKEYSFKLISINQMRENFSIINSKGDEIINSKDLNPEFVKGLMHMVFREAGINDDSNRLH